ncbi:MAG: hypothetical protein EPN38_06590 [Rhodanobacteraceae bacterium]|nr:MAG: hypothetical protein EPN38_06590 [Rhodanobacteraceae bacterium]
MSIATSAPGKLVLLGEYAVLDGAPALVLAVNRRANATLTPIPGDCFEIISPTLGMAARLRPGDGAAHRRGPAPPAELAWIATLLAHFGPARTLPACRVELDSDAFYVDHAGARVKLGLGSSAALAVALLGALRALAQLPPPALAEAIAMHRAIQGGRGSGIDIAASLAGGLTRFQLDAAGAAHATPASLPRGLHMCCVYSGRPASTRAMLAEVAAWRTHAPGAYTRHIRELATISSRGVDAVATGDAAAFLSSLSAYAQTLARFGHACGVDIASREHQTIGAIATDCGCVYKSCGAGGGDVGITFGVDNHRVQVFASRAARAGFRVIGLEADPRGLGMMVNV